MPFTAIAHGTLRVRQRRGGGVASYLGADAFLSEGGVDQFVASVATGRGGNFSASESAVDVLSMFGAVSGSGSGGGDPLAITWTAPTQNEDGSTLSDLEMFEIYRSSSGSFTDFASLYAAAVAGTAKLLTDVLPTVTSYVDPSPPTGTVYYYVVAYDSDGTPSTPSRITRTYS